MGLKNRICPDRSIEFNVHGQWSSAHCDNAFVEILKCPFAAENPEEECEKDPEIL